MLGFLAETLRGTHKDNTLHTIELAKRARDIYFKIADEENIEFSLLKKGILRFYDSKKNSVRMLQRNPGLSSLAWSGMF